MDDFNDDIDTQTDYFLKQVSDNSEGTKTIGGSLGIQQASHYSDAMFNGFALGALTLEKGLASNNGKITGADDGIYKKLSDAMQAAYNEVLSISGKTSNSITSNEEMSQLIDSLDATRVQNIFGKEMRNLFDPKALNDSVSVGKKGRALVYTDLNSATAGNENKAKYAFITTEDKGGIHLVKRYEIDKNQLNVLAISDLKKIAEADDPSKAEYNLVSYLSPMLAQDNVVKELITKDATNTSPEYLAFEKFIQGKIDNKEIEVAQPDGSTIPNTGEGLLKDASDKINDRNLLKAQGIASRIASGHTKYLTDAIDKKEIAYKPFTGSSNSAQLADSEILVPEDIYKEAFELAKAENGVSI